MKASVLATIIASLTFNMHGIAHADVLIDLPNPNEQTVNQQNNNPSNSDSEKNSQSTVNKSPISSDKVEKNTPKVQTVKVKAKVNSSGPSSTKRKPVVARPPVPPPPPTPEIQESSLITVKDKVLYVDGYSFHTGTVLEVFQSGDANVQLDEYDSPTVLSITKLGKLMSCYYGSSRLCSKDRVLYSSGSSFYAGQVVHAYSNGYLEVALDGYDSLSTVAAASLSKAVNCTNNNICTYDNVDYKNGYSQYVGKVKEIYQNGKAAVIFDDYDSVSIVDATSLGKSVKCLKYICKNGQVLYDNGSSTYVGTVVDVFSIGQAKVLLSGYSSTSLIPTENLYNELRCDYGRNICKGDRVLWSNGYSKYPGTVVSIFSNSKAAVILDGYSDNSIVRTSELFK
ncbi:MAG: hypothetical protein ACXVCN_12365 [Bdellovibrio sp.]